MSAVYVITGFLPAFVLAGLVMKWVYFETALLLIGAWFLLLVIFAAVETVLHQRELKRSKFLKRYNINPN
ncbi:hypothetical protein Rm378p001 [Rhodothermus phage RM378]|uniref:hypothetical protein n=1 Tax=Rhodothermus phage RM378 TaxID=148943 RepID=UPI000018F614|nr:hypothetical protein Rm378p001 [Rhodothermus phage RM378]